MALGDTRGGDIGWKKWLMATWAVLEGLLFSGVMFGWPSLVWVLKDQDVYADLCPDDHGAGPLGATNTSLPTTLQGGVTQSVTSTNTMGATDDDDKCDAQDSRLMLCFTIASIMFGIGAALLSYINYKFGTRINRIIYFWIYVPGVLCLAFVTTDTPWLMFPGLILIGVGGLQVTVTNIQVAKLFQKGSSLVGLLSGAFDTSSAVMLIVKLAYERGVSPRYIFIALACMYTVMIAVSTFLFLPKGFIKAPNEAIDYQMVSNKAKTTANAKTDVPTLKSCLKNPMYITHVAWHCTLQLRFHFFIGSVNTFLNRKLDDDDDLVSYFTNVLLYTMMGGLVASLIAGLTHDWQKRYYSRQESKSKSYRDVMPAVLPQSLTSGMAVLLSVLVLFDQQALLYVVFITMTVYRSYLYSMAIAFIADIFPIPYFGFLYGLMVVAAGLVGLLQYALLTWTEAYDGAPLHTDIFLLCLVLLSFVHPLNLWRRARNGTTQLT